MSECQQDCLDDHQRNLAYDPNVGNGSLADLQPHRVPMSAKGG